MALLALLLSAAAVAVHGSLDSHAENTRMAAATQAARVVLNRITRDIRTAAAVDSTAGSSVLRVIPPDDGSGLTQIEYEHDYSNKRLLYRRTVGGETTTSTLLGGDDGIEVRVFYLTYELGQDWQGLDCTKSVTIHLAFDSDNQTVDVTASGSPRRNQTY
jgi:hypothetical protein